MEGGDIIPAIISVVDNRYPLGGAVVGGSGECDVSSASIVLLLSDASSRTPSEGRGAPSAKISSSSGDDDEVVGEGVGDTPMGGSTIPRGLMVRMLPVEAVLMVTTMRVITTLSGIRVIINACPQYFFCSSFLLPSLLPSSLFETTL